MTDYYVDATGGNDGWDGLSPGTAWQTIGHVNGQAFNAGDSILFKRGETWTGTALTIPSSGAAGNPITFADYDVGARPIIDGNDAVNCIQANAKDYLAFTNIECTQGLDSGFQFTNCDHVIVTDCIAHDCGNDNLVFISGCHGCSVVRGEFYDAYQRVGGTVASGIEIAEGCYDITVSGSACYGNALAGVTIISHALSIFPYNIIIQNVDCHSNAEHGIYVYKQDNTVDADRNIQIIGCNCYTNTQAGLYLTKSVAATAHIVGVTIDLCNFHDNTTYAAYIQGDDITVQRTIIHEGRMMRLNSANNVTIRNCTFYLTTNVGYGQIQGFDTLARGTTVITIQNCVFYSPDAANYMYDFQPTVPSAATINYNTYSAPPANVRWKWQGVLKNWANWKADSGQDANSPLPSVNPLFINVAGDNFRLPHGSPALNIGTPVGIKYYGTAPDCGRYEMRWAWTPQMGAPRFVTT